MWTWKKENKSPRSSSCEHPANKIINILTPQQVALDVWYRAQNIKWWGRFLSAWNSKRFLWGAGYQDFRIEGLWSCSWLRRNHHSYAQRNPIANRLGRPIRPPRSEMKGAKQMTKESLKNKSSVSKMVIVPCWAVAGDSVEIVYGSWAVCDRPHAWMAASCRAQKPKNSERFRRFLLHLHVWTCTLKHAWRE